MGDALTPPWSVRPLHKYDGSDRAAVVTLMGCDDFLQMCRRDLLRGYIDRAMGHPNATMADFLPRLSMALRTLACHDVSMEPRRACEYALDLLELPSKTRRGRSYNLQIWMDCLREQLDVRELRRHRASDEAIEHRRRMAYGGFAMGAASGLLSARDAGSDRPTHTTPRKAMEASGKSRRDAGRHSLERHRRARANSYLLLPRGPSKRASLARWVRRNTAAQLLPTLTYSYLGSS